MRKIKFRAWAVKPKIMYENVELDWKINDMTSDDRFKVMQYTGLKDKNGKEIYEGDILEIDGKLFKDGKPKKAVMLWDKYCYGWRMEIDAEKKVKENHIEIIGNIHENPELLR